MEERYSEEGRYEFQNTVSEQHEFEDPYANSDDLSLPGHDLHMQDKWLLRQDIEAKRIKAEAEKKNKQSKSLMNFVKPGESSSSLRSLDIPQDSEYELKSSSVAYFDNVSDIASIFSPVQQDNNEEIIKRYIGQINNLEADMVTLMDELDAMTIKKTELEKSALSSVNELAAAKEDAKTARMECRELKDSVRFIKNKRDGCPSTLFYISSLPRVRFQPSVLTAFSSSFFPCIYSCNEVSKQKICF